MDTNRLFTDPFGGWLTAADKAAATTINFTRSNLRPCISDLIQNLNHAHDQRFERGFGSADAARGGVVQVDFLLSSLPLIVRSRQSSRRSYLLRCACKPCINFYAQRVKSRRGVSAQGWQHYWRVA